MRNNYDARTVIDVLVAMCPNGFEVDRGLVGERVVRAYGVEGRGGTIEEAGMDLVREICNEVDDRLFVPEITGYGGEWMDRVRKVGAAIKDGTLRKVEKSDRVLKAIQTLNEVRELRDGASAEERAEIDEMIRKASQLVSGGKP